MVVIKTKIIGTVLPCVQNIVIISFIKHEKNVYVELHLDKKVLEAISKSCPLSTMGRNSEVRDTKSYQCIITQDLKQQPFSIRSRKYKVLLSENVHFKLPGNQKMRGYTYL